MINDTCYMLDNGIEVQYTEDGVRYTLNDKMLTIRGEWCVGDVHLNDQFIGSYVRDSSDVAWFEMASGQQMRIGEDEEEYAAFAKRMLR